MTNLTDKIERTKILRDKAEKTVMELSEIVLLSENKSHGPTVDEEELQDAIQYCNKLNAKYNDLLNQQKTAMSESSDDNKSDTTNESIDSDSDSEFENQESVKLSVATLKQRFEQKPASPVPPHQNKKLPGQNVTKIVNHIESVEHISKYAPQYRQALQNNKEALKKESEPTATRSPKPS